MTNAEDAASFDSPAHASAGSGGSSSNDPSHAVVVARREFLASQLNKAIKWLSKRVRRNDKRAAAAAAAASSAASGGAGGGKAASSSLSTSGVFKSSSVVEVLPPSVLATGMGRQSDALLHSAHAAAADTATPTTTGPPAAATAATAAAKAATPPALHSYASSPNCAIRLPVLLHTFSMRQPIPLFRDYEWQLLAAVILATLRDS
jgi:hypothetical protein